MHGGSFDFIARLRSEKVISFCTCDTCRFKTFDSFVTLTRRRRRISKRFSNQPHSIQRILYISHHCATYLSLQSITTGLDCVCLYLTVHFETLESFSWRRKFTIMRHRWRVIVLFSFVSSVVYTNATLWTNTFPPTSGPIEGATCNVEDLEEANDSQLHSILEHLVETSFFKNFVVDLDESCPISTWHTKKSKPAKEETQKSESTTKKIGRGASTRARGGGILYGTSRHGSRCETCMLG